MTKAARFWSLLVVFIGGANIILGLTSLVDDLITWKTWFEAGVLNHYQSAKAYLLALLPFPIPHPVFDGLMIWSGFSFWSGRAFASYAGRPYDSGEWWLQVLFSISGPFGLGALIIGYLHQRDAAGMRRAFALVGKEEPDYPDDLRNQLLSTVLKNQADDARRIANSILAAGAVLFLVLTSLLFVASDALIHIT